MANIKKTTAPATTASVAGRMSGLPAGWLVGGSPEYVAWRKRYEADNFDPVAGSIRSGILYENDPLSSGIGNWQAGDNVLTRAGAKNVAFNPETGEAVGLDASGNPIDGSAFSVKTNDTDFYNAAALMMGGAVGGMAAGGAFGGGAATTAGGTTAAGGAGGGTIAGGSGITLGSGGGAGLTLGEGSAALMGSGTATTASGAGGLAGSGITAAGTTAGGTAAGLGSTGLGAAGGASMAGALTGAGGGMASASSIPWGDILKTGTSLYLADQAMDSADANAAGMRDIAGRQLDLSQQAMEWFQGKYDEGKGARDAAEKRAQDVSNLQQEQMRFAIDQAKELDNYNKTTFRPAEQAFIDKSLSYDTPEKRAAAAAAAGADVDSSAALARQAIQRAMSRSNIAPGGGSMAAAMEDSALKQATARGGAMTKAMRDVEQQGFARMADVVNLGRGVPTQQATQQQIATSAGNSSVGNAMQGVNANMAGIPTMQSAFTNGLNGMTAAGNLYNNAARVGLAEDEAMLNAISNIGKYLGGGG